MPSSALSAHGSVYGGDWGGLELNLEPWTLESRPLTLEYSPFTLDNQHLPPMFRSMPSSALPAHGRVYRGDGEGLALNPRPQAHKSRP
jgi:hypothetical protein